MFLLSIYIFLVRKFVSDKNICLLNQTVVTTDNTYLYVTQSVDIIM